MDENNENKRLGGKYYAIINTALFVLIATSLVKALLYAFNLGFNNYFGIPSFLTAASPSGLLADTPKLCLVVIIFLLSAVILIAIFYCLLNSLKNIGLTKKLYTPLGLTALMCIFLIAELLLYLKNPTLLNLAVLLIVLISFALIVYLLVKADKLSKIKKSQSDEEKSEKAGNKLETLNYLVEKAAIKLDLIMKIIIILLLFMGVFLSLYFYGMFSALKQESHYLTSDGKAVVAVYENNAVAIDLYVENGIYKTSGIYSLIPIEGLEMHIEKTGVILSEHQSNFFS